MPSFRKAPVATPKEPVAAPATPSSSGPALSTAEIERRIKEGNKNRGKEKSEKETEKERQMAEERDELVSGVQKAINFIIALVFVSMPLSEPVIDWLVVGVFISINLIWNLFFHQNTTIHMAVLLLMNFVLTQYVDHIKLLPTIAVTISPVAYLAFFIGNGSVGFAEYWFYIKKAKSRADRESRIDLAIVGTLVLNFVVLFCCGVITTQQITFGLRAIWAAITNLSING
jgi:hypothetical protein